MLDPAVSLAFNVQANPGAYALLLGSGLSRSAAIPTGWEIVQDLVGRYAALKKEDTGGDAVAWYTKTFGAEPNYSKLLDELAGTAAERNRILRGYFEPSPDERQAGQKTPTRAHHAIARLVAGGYVRVIVTTNFDRLIETALEAAGIVPTMISSEDQAIGATPLQLNKCTIVKVNGDYTDLRTKNTAEELASYGPSVTSLLDRIFDEYGLIVCGWSGDWDAALRAALERTRSRRFTTYWAARSDLTEEGRRLFEHIEGVVVPIVSADAFFIEVAEKVQSVSDLNSPHPITAALAVATLKRLLPDPSQVIRLDDLISQECDLLVERCAAAEFSPQGGTSPSEIVRRIERYEAVADTMLHLIAAGTYFGKPEHDRLWVRAIQRIGTDRGESSGITLYINLRAYPATILLYAAGIAAVAGERYSALAEILTRTVVITSDREEAPFILTRGFTDRDFAKTIEGLERNYTAMSDHLHKILREPLRRYLPADEDYERAFDRFEALTSIVFVTLREGGGEYYPAGRFGWRNGRGGWTVRQELNSRSGPWISMKACFPPVQQERFLEAAALISKGPLWF